MLVLIWLVQLVIYPSLNHYTIKNLRNWHRSYTKRITYVVLPLMIGQLLFAIIKMTIVFDILIAMKLLLIIAVWILTFGIFVPLHSAVETMEETNSITEKLIRLNWSRTIVWSLIFVIGLFQVSKPYLF